MRQRQRSANFIQTSPGGLIPIVAPVSIGPILQASSGDIMFVDVVTDATTGAYTEITPSGTETYTEAPSGTETYTEIVR